MSAKTKKIDKEFILSDSSVNVYGFRLLTSGCLLDEFKKNPIGYYNHDDADGILIRWDDLHVDGDRIIGKPVVNLSHPRGERTAQEIEDSVLIAASVGDIVLLDYTTEMKDGEEILVATKWYNKECSVVDKPGNRNAFTLCDASGEKINLSDLTSKHIEQMKKITLAITPALISMLGLADNADEQQLEAKIKDLHDAKLRAEGEANTLKAAKQKAEQELQDLKDKTADDAVKAILEKGLNDKKLTKQLSDLLSSQYKGKPDELKAVVDAMPAYAPITPQLSDSGVKDKAALVKEYDERFENGTLKDLSDERLKELKEAKFGKK